MFTWILIAIIVAALFGVINVDKVRAQLIELGKKYLPIAIKYYNIAKDKLIEYQNKQKNNSDDKNDKN